MYKCLSGISPIVQWSSFKEFVWKSSSSSSSSSRSSHMSRVQIGGGCCRKATGFFTDAILGDKGLSTVRVSSSSEELKVNHHGTGLQCDWLTPVPCGVARSKETFSSLETWCILEVLLSGVGMLKFHYLSHILHPLMWVYSWMLHWVWSQATE